MNASTRHAQLVKKAIQLIQQIACDTSVSKETNEESLCELRAELDIQIEALKCED